MSKAFTDPCPIPLPPNFATALRRGLSITRETLDFFPTQEPGDLFEKGCFVVIDRCEWGVVIGSEVVYSDGFVREYCLGSYIGSEPEDGLFEALDNGDFSRHPKRIERYTAELKAELLDAIAERKRETQKQLRVELVTQAFKRASGDIQNKVEILLGLRKESE
jgi:hypothetical protein